jgi:Protein of unknown function (DUF1018)
MLQPHTVQAKPAAPKVHADARRADLAAIHKMAAALGWSDDEYRDIMATVCAGIRSAANLDHTGRKRLLAHMQSCITASGASKRGTAPRPALTGPQRLIWSLWMRLADAGKVDKRSMAALNAFVERQSQVQQMTWLNAEQQKLVIESLKRWLTRGSPDV